MLKAKQTEIDSQSIFKRYWYIFILALIAILSFGLNFFAISKTGYGNAYYAAAIKSMTESFKNFFYVSFDPAGMVSVDKPPLGLWIQAIFVLIFGYHGWAMLLPQALAGTASCIMMYILTAKYFGRPAGLISCLVFALTPAVVVASRNNTIDMQLVFVLLVAVWFLLKAIEKTKWRYLFLCALFVGLGFNIKMLQAYMILPAVAIVYLVFAKEKFLKRILAGVISVVIAAVVSFAWVFAVDFTPASSRPYVDSSTDNTVLELIIGHNGVERLYGQNMGGGGMGGGSGKGMGSTGNGFGGQNTNMQADGQNNTNGTPPAMPDQNGTDQKDNSQNGNTNGTPPAMPDQNGNTMNANGNSGTPGQSDGQSQNGSGNQGNGQFSGPDGQGGSNDGGHGGAQNGGQGGGGVTGNDIGSAGILRLWNSGCYGQVTWLIVFVLFCIAVKIRKFDFKNLQLKQAVFVLWVLWLITMYAFFSFAGFWHRYYLCMFAPAIAGLAGPGLIEMIQAFKDKRGWKQILLPLSLITTFVIEFLYVWSYSALRVWLIPIMAAAFVFALVFMVLHYFKPKQLLLFAASGCMLASLLAAPFYWSLTVVMYPPQNVTMPYAGPELASTASVPGMTSNQETLTTGDSGTIALENYLVANYKEGSFLVVSQRADDVAQFIVDTGLPAVAYGGFLGSDNSMTVDELKELVSEGKVTYFLISSQNGNTNSDLLSYVKENATLISSSEYGVTDSQSSEGGASQQSSNGVSGSSLYLFE